jgi:hypothetical protein
MARPRKAEAAQIASRRADALRMQIEGASLAVIGRALAADPELNSSGRGYPMGYGRERYVRGQAPATAEDLVRLASEDIARACAQNRDVLAGAVDDLQQIERLRLEQLHGALWPAAMGGDLPAIDRVLRIMERRDRLLGLDAPARTEVEVTRRDAELDAEIELLLAGVSHSDWSSRQARSA